MEVEEMQNFPRINRNGKKESGPKSEEHEHYQYEEEGDGEVKRGGGTTGSGGGRGRVNSIDITNPSGLGRLYNWPSSRIVRVSRASGGKDRHSKVWTSKGLRDRRVRLSVPTAIQFYDLQDRLGYDQPSKAVEWLLTAASTSIAELPSISSPFPDTPQQLTDATRRPSSADNEPRFDLAQAEIDEADEDDDMLLQQQQDGNGAKALSKSACSSTSETSKGSGLSFSRSESRIKARERARERAAEKEKKEKDNEGCRMGSRNLDPISQNSSFTELLTGGIHTQQNNNNHSPNGNCSNNGNGNANESNLFQKSSREWASTSSMDYFATGLLNSSTTRPVTSSSNFLGQIQLGNHPLQQPVASPVFTITGGDQIHHELPHFSFLPDHLVPGRGGSGSSSNNNNNNNGDYNLNFCVSSSSSGLAGFNRGTLQSNSSLLPHLQRFPTTIDGPSAFFISTATPVTNAAVVTPVENQYHHFLSGFDPQLQLCYDANGRHHDHKGKGKN